MALKDSDSISFAKEESHSDQDLAGAWKVIIADDEPSVHLVTQLALGGFQFDGRGLKLLSAYDEDDVRTLIAQHPDTALILLDVVMDTANSGFDVVRHIREEAKNKHVRIILRTGQSGYSPEDRVIIDYDINDFKDKTELTVAKLRTAIIASLRSYRNQLKLDSAKNYLQQVVNRTASILITTDNNLGVKLWNAQAERAFGVGSEIAMGQSVLEIHPWFEGLEGLFRKALTSGVDIEHPNVPFLDDGRQIVNVSITPMDNPEEKELLIRIDNVTVFRRKEKQIALMERMDALNSVGEEWESQLRQITTRIASILDPGAEKSCQDFMDALAQTREVLEGMMEQTPNKNLRVQMSFQSLQLDSVLNTLVQDLRSSTTIPIHLGLQDEGVFMVGDPLLIEKCLKGIVENAISACKVRNPGEATVRVFLKRTSMNPEWLRVLVSTQEKTFLQVTVTDNGRGMSAQVRRGVFNPSFQQAIQEPNRGFSLNKVYQIVQIHMGFIDIESEEGEGTTVQVFLPEENPRITEAPVSGLTERIRGLGTVLVCDDDLIMRQVATNILQRFGFQIVTAENGRSALDIVRRKTEELRLVILDILMPGPGGLEIFMEIQRITPSLPVLLTSGFGENERVRQALKRGAAGFLPKPYGWEKLVSEVFGILGEKYQN